MAGMSALPSPQLHRLSGLERRESQKSPPWTEL